jgi:hypothetical protein
VPLSPIILLTSSAFCDINMAEPRRRRGSCIGSSRSASDDDEYVSEGAVERGEPLPGSSGIQWLVVVLRKAIGLCKERDMMSDGLEATRRNMYFTTES